MTILYEGAPISARAEDDLRRVNNRVSSLYEKLSNARGEFVLGPDDVISVRKSFGTTTVTVKNADKASVGEDEMHAQQVLEYDDGLAEVTDARIEIFHGPADSETDADHTRTIPKNAVNGFISGIVDSIEAEL